MRLVTGNEMKTIDQKAMMEYGLPPVVLMENAGAAVVRHSSKEVDWAGKRVCIVCGKGNNGGDGFVIARYAENAGADVIVFYIGERKKYSEEAQHHFQIMEHLDCAIHKLRENENRDIFFHHIRNADIIVDAILGTGIQGAVRPFEEELIHTINQNTGYTIAVDIPSGINSDTGEGEVAVQADVTVTFGCYKQGMFFYPGKACCGKVYLDTIGMPRALLRGLSLTELLDQSQIRDAIIPRTPDSHKGRNGFIGIIAGSNGMSGAALMAGIGALRGGAGKVNVLVPEAIFDQCAGKYPELMTKGIGDTYSTHFTKIHESLCCAVAQLWQAAAIGPGLGRSNDTKVFIQAMLKRLSIPLVLDADALYLLKGEQELVRSYQSVIIMTPHMGEFAHLTGKDTETLLRNKIEEARAFARDWNCILVLKGAPTVIALPEGNVYVNNTGNSGMATGGMGDVLTGLIVSLLGQGLHGDMAAAVGAYIHGAGGDRLWEEFGDRGYRATEVADQIPRVIRDIVGKK